MLLYVIPFILLLVVAIVLKKREDANKENDSANAKKSNNKKTAKKNIARTARTSQRQQTSVVENSVIVQQTSKPLSADLKQSIEKLIVEKNYFSAEAKINQALNQDNAQHELYLYLLDVHLAQKDEFAVNQLINHIRSLGLDEIVAQAEEHQKAAQAESPIESIAFEPSNLTTPETKDTTAFDALIGNTETIPEVVKPTPAPQNKTFETLEFSTPPVETQKEAPQPPVQPLEFTLETSTKELTTDTLSFEPTAPVEEIKTDTVAPLEFSFTPNQQPTPVEKPAEIAPEFKLDFAEPTTAPIIEEPKQATDVEFKLTPSEVEAQPSFSFELDEKDPAIEQEVTNPTSSFNVASESPVTANVSIDVNDPLISSFPELAEVNEIQLNLELAQQYISLGAYASARVLLSQDESSYTPEQRRVSQNLLNQIAS